MEHSPERIKGRGAQSNPTHRFSGLNYDEKELLPNDDEPFDLKTVFREVHPKTILNKVKSADIPFGLSMNPYEGCEHGCVYCYARDTHPYWGLSAGLDFESIILVKKNAPELLKTELSKPSHRPEPIMFSGNTDCYQPGEKKFGLTRAMLQILLDARHPTAMITKNSLIERDLDILKEMAAMQLVSVAITITSLDENFRRNVEPRTSTFKSRLETIELLSKNNIPVMGMMAPIIPGLNDHEILPMARAMADAGALGMSYTVIRLNGEVEKIFTDWLEKTYPLRYQKIMHLIQQCHDGQYSSSVSGERMRGKGVFAEHIRNQFILARNKFFKNRSLPPLRTDLFIPPPRNGQMRLF